MSTLEWIGQDKVVNHHLEVPYRVLEEQYTYNSEQSENMIIRGDNLGALRPCCPGIRSRLRISVLVIPEYRSCTFFDQTNR